jgi:membrane protease YdiL (CAAX protease family)
MLGFLVVGIPLQLGWMLLVARRAGLGPSLRAVVLYRERLPVWQVAAWGLLILAYAFGVFIVLGPVLGPLGAEAFAWLPAALRPDGLSGPEPSKGAVLATLILLLVVDGLVNPVVEEMYFRGYLLPRIAWLGWLGPLLGAFLFTVQHFWQPHNYPLIFLVQLPLVYLVWWKRNIFISMVAHCAANTLGATMSLVAFLGQP